eukprot:SRR837773.1707.p1 GENE.SRR837773.1707~~SRR837773.1707.p1  ORF type:complete len:482 (-),score=54.76 SRR837773.1707:65-1510(-)
MASPELAAPTCDHTLREDALRLVAGLRRLFTELSEPSRRTPSSALDVAATLYGKELGTQQDCDELWHRLSLLVDDGLKEFEGRPFDPLQKAFGDLFRGATCELRLRSGMVGGSHADAAASEFSPVREVAKKPFLTIPVQGGNKTLEQAIDEFTSWSSTGGEDIAWTQERLNTCPPYLCFASRQVSDLEWEDSLNLTRFLVPSSSSMERRLYQRSKASQLHAELRAALEQLIPGQAHLTKADVVSGRCFGESLGKLSSICRHLETQAQALAAQLAELEQQIGDGFDEAPLDDFLAAIITTASTRATLVQRLGVQTVKDLAKALFGGGARGAALSALTTSADAFLSQAEADALRDALQRRWDDHHTYMFDLHGIILYQGLGQWGHYVAFIRQDSGTFLCFDDEKVYELPDTAAVRADIAERGGEGLPASVRMVVYRRRAPGGAQALPIEVESHASAAGAAVSNGTKRDIADVGDEGNAKRLRT